MVEKKRIETKVTMSSHCTEKVECITNITMILQILSVYDDQHWDIVVVISHYHHLVQNH